ncbi:MAG: TonB-dependent receptor [Roseateles sp.]|uniref:TonB-dependent receptor n=1 Tax=Roseateles sp. TaxID=1971397 RepID=UPI0039EAF102
MPTHIRRQPPLHLTTLAALVSTSFALPLAAQTVAPPQAAASAPRAAPDEPASLERIVVTAQRRAEPLQAVPLSISALSGAQIKNANVTSADRLEQLIPGLRMGRSGSDLRPAMRGTYTENVAANGDPRFGIYVDDIYQSRTSQVPPIVDLARVEVQKGPQGTLYGRNSFGGNIVFHSAEPTDHFEGGLDLGFGNFGRKRAEGHVNVPISEGVAVRFAGLAEDASGYVKNIGTGNDLGGESQKFVRATLRIAPAARPELEVLLRGSYLDLGGEGLGGFGYKILGTLVDPGLIRKPGESLTHGGATYELPNGFNGNSWTGVGMPIDTRYRDGIADVAGADIGIPTLADPYTVDYAGEVFRKGRQQQYGATVNYDVGPVRLRSISSYTDFDIVRTGGSLTPVLLNYSYAQTATRTFTQEFQLLSNDEKSPLQWIVGGYYFNDTARDRGVTNVNRGYVTATAPAGQQYYPFGFTYAASGTGFDQRAAYDSFGAQQQKTRSLAAYGQLSYTLFDKLTLTAGLRHTRDEKTVLATRFNTAATGPGAYFAHSMDDPVDYRCGSYVAANAASVSASATAVSQAYNFICANNAYSYDTYRLAADYKLNADQMVYASYSTGVHAGGFNTGPVSINGVPTLLPFAPEKVKAFEVGSKNSFFDRMLTLNAAAFVNDYRDLHAQTSIPNPNSPLTSVIALVQNIGKDRAYGLDLEAVLRPTRNLRATLAYNWLNAKQIDYAVNTFNFGGAASFCGITPSCDAASGEANTVQGTPFPNSRTDANRFVPVVDASGAPVVTGGVPQYRYVIAGTGRDGTKYTSKKAFSPKQTFQVGLSYDIPLGNAGTLTPEVQAYYNSGYILTDLTPDYGNNPSYTKTDLRLTYRSADRDFHVQLYVNNVEDKAIITRASYTNHRALLVNYAPPRTYGINAGFRF